MYTSIKFMNCMEHVVELIGFQSLHNTSLEFTRLSWSVQGDTLTNMSLTVDQKSDSCCQFGLVLCIVYSWLGCVPPEPLWLRLAHSMLQGCLFLRVGGPKVALEHHLGTLWYHFLPICLHFGSICSE